GVAVEVAAEREEGAVEGEGAGVAGPLALGPVELAAAEGLRVLRVGHLAGEAGEVPELLPSPLAHERPQLRVVVGEELKGRGGGPLLAHEQERQLGREEEEGRGRTVGGRRDVVGEAVAGRPIAHLVVVLDADDALLRPDSFRARPARLAGAAARTAVV